MIRLYSSRPDDVVVPVFRQRPLQFDKEEFVFTPRHLTIKGGAVTEVKDDDAPTVLGRIGKTGVIEVKEGTDQVTMEREGRTLRYDFLLKHLTYYQQCVAQQMAMGTAPSLPTLELRRMHEEFKVLKVKVIAEDPLLSEQLPTVAMPTAAQMLNETLAEMGVPNGVVAQRPNLAEMGL